MARANLTVDNEVVAAFKAAQEPTSNIRYLQIEIADGKEEMSLAASVEKTGDCQSDFEFDALVPALLPDKACIIMFRVDSTIDAPSGDDAAASTVFQGQGKAEYWLMLCWTPETARVREKMMYSSSREDLKEALGRALITQEFSATCEKEVSWALYQVRKSHKAYKATI